MGNKTSTKTSPKESCQLSDGVEWKAYGFDCQGNYSEKNCSEKGWHLTEDTGNNFCWYHGELSNRNQKLSSFKEIVIEKLCPHLKPEDITRMLSGGPFCDYVDGALFLRVNSSGPSLSNFGLRLAARITKNLVITISFGPNLRLDLSPENQNLDRNDKMVELDENDIEKGDGPKNSTLVRNEEKGVPAKKGIEEGDGENRLDVIDNPVVTGPGDLLAHIVNKHMDHLQDIVTKLEIVLDTIEGSMESIWENIEARMGIGGGTPNRETWDDRKLAKMHLDLQRLLQVIAHVEQVFPHVKKKCGRNGSLVVTDNIPDANKVSERLGRLKENVGFIDRRVAAIQADFDNRQAAFDSRRATQINQKLYYLSILSVILLPLSCITGIFGLSVGGVPWKDHKDGFRNVILICVVTTVVLLPCLALFRVLYRRLKKWVCEYK